MAGIKPVGSEAKIPCETFLKVISNLFSNALRGQDVSEDMGPFDILIAYRDMFNQIDSDADGRIYPDQLHELVRGLTRMESAGVSRSPDLASTEMIVNHLDKAKKGYVDYADFLAGALLATEPPAHETSASIENEGEEDGEFASALGPPASQHSSVFEDSLDWDSAPASKTSAPSTPSRGGASASASGDSASVSQLKTLAYTLEQRLSTAQSELDKSESSRAELLTRVGEQDKAIEGFKKQLKSVAESDSERIRLSDEMEQLRANLNQTKEALKTAQKNESELASERDRLKEDLYQKGKEINDISDQLRALSDSAAGADAANQLVASLQAQLAAQTERYESLLKAKDTTDEEHKKLIQALQDLQSKHSELQLDAEDAKRKLTELTDSSSALAQQPRTNKGGNLKAELNSTMARPMSPLKQGDYMSSSLPSASSVLSDSTTGNNDELLQLRIELDMLAKEKKALLAHLSDADSKASAFEREKAELNKKLQALNDSLTKAERDKGSLQRLYDEAKTELDELKATLQASQDAVNAANAAAAKAAASAFTAPPSSPLTDAEMDELRSLRLARRELEDQLARIKQQSDSDSLQVKALRNEVQQLREHNRSLKAKVAQFPEEHVSLSSEEDMRRGLIGGSRVVRHDKGCCDTCTIL